MLERPKQVRPSTRLSQDKIEYAHSGFRFVACLDTRYANFWCNWMLRCIRLDFWTHRALHGHAPLWTRATTRMERLPAVVFRLLWNL
jgi:hypothetical protein